MSRKNNQFKESAYLNTITYDRYFMQLKEIAVTRFEWENLPPSVDERFMEITLFEKGCAVAFVDDDLPNSSNKMVLPVAASGNYDVYTNPIYRRAWSNGYNKELSNKDSVIIYNNYLRQSSTNIIAQYARMLYDIDRTITVNLNAQKTPMLIQCDKEQQLTLENLYKDYIGNIPVIFGGNKLNPNAIQVFQTGAPFIADRLQEIKTQIFNECLTYLGVSNVSFQKRERLISDEVNRQMGGTFACRNSGLLARKQACEEINRMLGWDITVKFRDIEENVSRETFSDESEGVQEE